MKTQSERPGGRHPGPKESERGKIALAVAGAIGGAVLGFSGNLALHKISQTEASEAANLQKGEAVETAKKEFALKSHKEYRALGDLPRRSAAYIDSGQDGSQADVRELFRHLHDLVALVRLGDVDKRYINKTYGGDLVSWSRRFRTLGSGSSPVSGSFASYELTDYCLLSRALGAIAGHSDSSSCASVAPPARGDPPPNPTVPSPPSRRSRVTDPSDTVNALTPTNPTPEVNEVLDDFLSASNGGDFDNRE